MALGLVYVPRRWFERTEIPATMNYRNDLNQFAVYTIHNAVVVIEEFSNRLFIGLGHGTAESWKIRQLFNRKYYSFDEAAGIDLRVFGNVTV
jgi:hypothetical protein